MRWPFTCANGSIYWCLPFKLSLLEVPKRDKRRNGKPTTLVGATYIEINPWSYDTLDLGAHLGGQNKFGYKL